MKVVCLKNDITSHLAACHEITVGKIYDADFFGKFVTSDLYKIYLTEGIYYRLHFKKLFLTLAEWREQQIDSILNDD